MKSLNLSENSIKDIGARNLSTCIYNIDDLRLVKCDITEEGVNALAKKIKERDKPVCYLVIHLTT